MPPRDPSIARALGPIGRSLGAVRAALGSGSGAPVRILVACSGGADSVALLGLLNLLARRDRLVLSVGHVDHGLRDESATEARAVAELAAALGLPYAADRLEIATGACLAARAREARRSALIAQASRAGAVVIALGHTASDQAETVLMRLARGTDLRGLGAMRRVGPAAITAAMDSRMLVCRPLLHISRSTARTLCHRLGLPFHDDPSNLDERAPRVRIRNRVVPELAGLHPGTEHALVAMARAAAEAEDALEVWSDKEFVARRRTPSGGEGVAVDLARLADLPVAVRRRLLRRTLIEGGVDATALARRTLDAIERHACAPGRARFDLHERRRVVLEGGVLRVEPGDGAT